MQGGGEGVGLAHAAVFAAEEPVVAAGEGDGGLAKTFGYGQARAARDHLAGGFPDPDHDAGGRGAERAEVVPVGVAGHDVLPEISQNTCLTSG